MDKLTGGGGFRPESATNEILPASLRSKARQAVARAEAYIRSRQSHNGGFCYYKSEYVDEPNLRDTYHAVAALALLDADVPRADELVQFLHNSRSWGLPYIYYYAFTLDSLGCASLIDARRLARIRDLTITMPRAGDNVVTSGWLESTLKTIHLKRRFADLLNLPEVVRFVGGLKTNGGYGDKPNLEDTCLCVSILALLTERPATSDTFAFVERLQVPSFGFTATDDSRTTNLDVVYAGMKCCTMLGVPVRYEADVLKFVLACQTSNGGFSRAPDALPDVALTHRALQVIGLVERDLLPAPSGRGCVAQPCH